MHSHHTTSLLQKPLEPISKLVPYSALILSVILIILFLIRFYLLEGFLIQRVYGRSYSDMNETNRRGFINHHIAGLMKITILIVAAYPFLTVAFGNSTFNTPFSHGSPVTKGDLLVVVAQMLIAIYVFELLYRVKLSPVAVLHHVGTIIIGQTSLAISLQLTREPDADIEFVLCTIWGAFDTISELFPHVAIILYRVYPTRHSFLRRLFLWSCCITAIGTLCETIVTMSLFGLLWHQWQMAFKVTTPLLHIAFSAAQIHGSLVFWRLYRKQGEYLKREKEDAEMQHDKMEIFKLAEPPKAVVTTQDSRACVDWPFAKDT
ncbi:hypothetical protein N7468_004037 [Penicillium chermesinum]|uniref:Uncharacterized protein n=1 Tax=Penicillium chermesinum TaxID=63820 RepID=A0A9W9P7P7_9EURO|nr:uncharacterized protein N7468_004037 [Penicillium chermesinum]KAJ5239418.1 hypothetical protein N7468_004037 [Penicillium chermesinum]